MVIAHVFGKWCNIDDVISVCHAHSVDVIEDCAEGFCGFKHLGVYPWKGIRGNLYLVGHAKLILDSHALPLLC